MSGKKPGKKPGKGASETPGKSAGKTPGRSAGKGLWGRYQRFFTEFALSRAKLAWFRVVFFTLIGVDGFLQISHAPRYGAGGFNVAHLAWLEGIAPGRSAILVVYLLQSYLGFRIAWGGAGRVLPGVLTALYGYAYFASQLDSYQHHYLVFLLLFVACFVPWTAPDPTSTRRQPGTKGLSGTAPVTSWALRLIFVQVALLYFWAAVAKLDPAWLDGTTIGRQIQPGFMRDMAQALGMGFVAKMVLFAELFLAAALFIPRLWTAALLVGVGLHASIELSGFEIGIFSYYMFAFYLLLVPDRVVDAGERVLAPVRAWLGARVERVAAEARIAWIACALLVVAGLGLWLVLPFAEAISAALISAVSILAALISAALRQRGALPDMRARAVTIALVHALACAAILGLHFKTDQAHDYYKYWGGTARRLGDWDDARTAYRMITRISPDWGPGHYHLANIARRDGHLDQALAGYARAQKVSPDDYRSYLAMAEIHHEARRGREALAAATRAIQLGPRRNSDLARAQAIYKFWSQTLQREKSAP